VIRKRPKGLMNIHEHQAKAVLSEFGVAVPRGYPAFSVDEAVQAAEKLGGPVFVVKAQIHAGGRGKGRFEGLGPDAKGGVRVVKSVDEVRANAQEMLGRVLVTHQTGPRGKQVNRLYIEEGAQIAKEFYLSLLVDRETSRVAVVASTEGGMDIEEVAASTPDKITTFAIDPATGVWPHHGLMLAEALGLKGDLAKQARTLLSQLYAAFNAKDMALLEINPLIVTADDKLRVLDAKVSFDDNALFRHPEIQALRDESEEDPKEIEASKHDLSYIALDGEIGCMVNGAGLAMATMDIIKLYGAEPANFLDVGGGASKEKVTAAFKIITADPNVKGILVNIFGGIMRGDIIAEGVVEAVKEVGLKVPLVVRLEGTNVEQGKQIIRDSGLNVIPANDLADGAEKIVKAVRGVPA
jgi:succinyl-CoA synthetase beta subunit